MKQFLVISYDITDNKNRLKVMKALEDYGKRVQYSVFECILTRRQVEQLQNRLKKHVGKLD
ncbi:MAG: CRISPR-associated endonuclease Cas2, partial [Anaerolineales bacterium]|nr:CRISPR-associated endonuclease Cas2 [Anaerolineales bacterium]